MVTVPVAWVACTSCCGRVVENGCLERGKRLGISNRGVNVNVNVSNLLAISESDFDNSGEPGPQEV